MLVLEIAVIVVLILVNGLLAMSELALVSARRARLESLQHEGRPGARAALALSDQPGQFLSTVQVGITLIGVLAGTFGGATVAEDLALWLGALPGLAPYAEATAFTVVVVAVTYASLIFGELVPKQLALRQPEVIAMRVAPLMSTVARLARPAVLVLDSSSGLILRLLGARHDTGPAVTEDEVRAAIVEGGRAGVLHETEHDLLRGVMRVADWTVEPLATPRAEVVWIDLDAGTEALHAVLATATHSRFPVARGSLDGVLGIVEVEDLLAQLVRGETLDPERVLQPPVTLRPSAPALEALDVLKGVPTHLALVVETGGRVTGVITETDILAAIAGGFAATGPGDTRPIVERSNGSWLVDGDVAVDLVADAVGLRALPGRREFHTLAGLVLWQLERVPMTGDAIQLGGFRIEVVDMDGQRIDKLLVSRLDDSTDAPGSAHR